MRYRAWSAAVVVALALLIAPAQPVAAGIVDFNEFSTSFISPGSFTSGGYTFSTSGGSCCLGVWTTAPSVGAFNGTPYLLDGYGGTLTMTRTDSIAFTMSSFEIAMGWYQGGSSLNLGVTYYLSGGGVVSSVLPLSLAFQTFAPGLTVSKVVFNIDNSPGGYISIDNIDATAVPEPSTLLLLGAGLVAGGRRLRARRR